MIRPRKQPDICQGTCSLTFRQYSTEDTDFSSVISIHAPAEGATKRGFAEWQNNVYFNPRSRGGSDAITYKEIREAIIFQSTLPRRERRYQRPGQCALWYISIHAPAEGATRNPDAVFLRLTYFNPRSRGGSDEEVVEKIGAVIDFNPRSRGGSD